MLANAFQRYINNFKGFSREIWILTTITFINRAGTMVLPFLTKYLKEDLQLSFEQVGWIMVFYGLGSMLGSYLGGKLSDKIGFYKIMVFSLFVSGLLFFALQYITSFWGLSIGMFILMVVADMFRPAMFVSIGSYANPENRARAFTLVRLAVNLGLAAGPALGGLLIMNIGYHGLFWVDGITCIIAIIIFAFMVKETPFDSPKNPILENQTAKISVFDDKIFWVFLIICFATAMTFFQLFSTLPLYHHDKYGMTELQTGLLITINGMIIFFLEMPIVSYFERKKTQKINLIFWGSLMMAISFFVLLFDAWSGILIVSLLFITFGEMFIFPFSNSFVLSRAPKGFEGRYMALFTMSFSVAHIGSSKIGMDIVAHFGYIPNWIFMGFIGVLAVICSLLVKKMLNKEALIPNTKIK